MIERQAKGQRRSKEMERTTTKDQLSKATRRFKDAALWIGERWYPEILCNQIPALDSEYFFPSNGKRPRSCFVHEAEVRGCCRKVAQIYTWMIPGESCMFLFSRDVNCNTEKKSCGLHFGYYSLKRFEVITDSKVNGTRGTGMGYTPIPYFITRLEALRSCGDRCEIGGIYVVDALAAAIIDRFIEEVSLRIRKGSLPRSWSKDSFIETLMNDEEELPREIEEWGRKIFENVVIQVNETHRNDMLTRIHENLTGARKRGELVVLGKYPIIERKYYAAFRGVVRLDGEEFFGEVSKCYNPGIKYVPRVPYFNKYNPGTDAEIAFKFRLTKSHAKTIVNGPGSMPPKNECRCCW